MSRMRALTNLDRESLLATFGAGVAGPDLEAQLRAHRGGAMSLMFLISTSSEIEKSSSLPRCCFVMTDQRHRAIWW